MLGDGSAKKITYGPVDLAAARSTYKCRQKKQTSGGGHGDKADTISKP